MASIKGLRAISEEYKEGKEIGKGTYGLVHMCAHVGTPHEQNLVIKKIDLAKMKRKEIADLVKEAKLLGMFNHPNIVKLRDYFITPDNLCIVQEFCNAKDLAYEVKVMKKTKKLFPENVIWTWFLQISAAVKHIHDRKILHRDIKTANIFLHMTDPKGWPVCRLGDFGISKGACNRTDAALCCRSACLRRHRCSCDCALAPADSTCAPHPLHLPPATALEATNALARSHVGTPYYMSPELCENKPYSYKSDVWSVGVVLYELASLRQPFGACVRAHNEHCQNITNLSHANPSSSLVRTRWCCRWQRRRRCTGAYECVFIYVCAHTAWESMCVTTRMYLCTCAYAQYLETDPTICVLTFVNVVACRFAQFQWPRAQNSQRQV